MDDNTYDHFKSLGLIGSDEIENEEDDIISYNK
jgi:hypothetical protein